MIEEQLIYEMMSPYEKMGEAVRGVQAMQGTQCVLLIFMTPKSIQKFTQHMVKDTIRDGRMKAIMK